MSTMSALSWTIGTSEPVILKGNMEVNSSINIGDFVLLLSAKNATNITSTATIDMVTSSHDGQQIACYSGNLLKTDTIAVAGTVVTGLYSKIVSEFPLLNKYPYICL